MKAIFKTKDLRDALAAVRRSANSGSTLPILGNVLIEARASNTTKFTTTNLEVASWRSIPCTTSEDGAATVPISDLLDVLATLDNETQVTLSWLKQTATLEIKAPGFNATLRGIDASEFPAIPEPSKAMPIVFSVALNQTQVKEITARACHCAAKDQSRPVLTAVHLSAKRTDSDKSMVTLESADGFRLAQLILRGMDVIWHASDKMTKADYLIPPEAFDEIARLFEKDSEQSLPVEFIHALPKVSGVCTSELGGYVRVKTPNGGVMRRLIEGKFPDTKKLIRDGHHLVCIAPTTELLAAIYTARVYARRSMNTVRFQCCPGKNELTILASNSEMGNYARVIGNVAYEVDGKPIQDAKPKTPQKKTKSKARKPVANNANDLLFALNAEYALDAIRAATYRHANAKESTVRLACVDAARPVHVPETNFLCVIMPMHINAGVQASETTISNVPATPPVPVPARGPVQDDAPASETPIIDEPVPPDSDIPIIAAEIPTSGELNVRSE